MVKAIYTEMRIIKVTKRWCVNKIIGLKVR